LVRTVLIWTAVVAVLAVPIVIASTSALLAWRGPVYIGAGFAGIVAFGLLFLPPLLAGAYLPGVNSRLGRRCHSLVGATIVAAVVVHVAGLWGTSPPDVIDVLLFRSPTPFSVWGAVAMWAVFCAAILASMRKRLRLKPPVWRLCHFSLVIIIVVGSTVHALLIEGTMGAAC